MKTTEMTINLHIQQLDEIADLLDTIQWQLVELKTMFMGKATGYEQLLLKFDEDIAKDIADDVLDQLKKEDK